jgi:hypothetical protein
LKIALKWRALTFGITIVLAVVMAARWQQAASHLNDFPPPSTLGNTWYGPVLLLLIPLSGAWLSLGAKDIRRRQLGLGCALALLLISLLVIYISMDFAGTLPSWIPSNRDV